ncbi:TrbG/VirB9 family P-type conjugative transfer protein [Helicobacter vulpis]|uniref:TrbG/VirB9 family P-type conjugative transfer protein n=1 Tax=Helicobacter vulpis TaxID=2316076 RepID=UPI001F18BEFD|nr:TrbG/VirB9 family P-type conjugative transfer protein [Helicobacter vulpis]
MKFSKLVMVAVLSAGLWGVESPGVVAQPSQEEEEEAPLHPMQDLNAIQKSFFYKKRQDLDNTLFIDYHLGETHRIRLRYAMVTMFVFEEPILEVILGDSVGFSSKVLNTDAHQNSNILLVKPLQIGIDSNLDVIGKSGKIYAFYIFSTTFTSSKNPTLSVYVSQRHFFAHQEQPQALLQSPLEEAPPSEQTQDDSHYLKIGDATNVMLVEKSQIQRGYRLLQERKRAWFCLWLCKVGFKRKNAITPLDIFNDAHFTYFKFNRQHSQVKFPVLYKVVDGYDNPINTRIVGDYLIAEDIADKWTLREGKQHACVRRTKP